MELLKGSLKKSFPDFDLEKVFFRTVFSEGIFLTMSLLWKFGEAWRSFVDFEEERKDSDKVEQEWEFATQAAGLNFWDKINLYNAGRDAVENEIGKQFIMTKTSIWIAALNILYDNGWSGKATERPENSVTFKYSDKDAENQILDLLEEIFSGQFSGYIMLGIPVLFVLLEARNYQKSRKAKRMFN